MSVKNEKEALECAIDLMEKETLYFKGKQRIKARQKYIRLLKMCGKQCQFNDSIYINRI